MYIYHACLPTRTRARTHLYLTSLHLDGGARDRCVCCNPPLVLSVAVFKPIPTYRFQDIVRIILLLLCVVRVY